MIKRIYTKIRALDKETSSTWIHFFTKTLVLVSLTPLVISKFTNGEIALWYLFVSIQSLGHLFDLGFSATIIRYTAYCLALPKDRIEDELHDNYLTMNTIFLVLTVLVFIFLCLVGYFNVSQLLIKYQISNGWMAWWALCALFPLSFYFKKNDAFLKGLNEITLVNNWNSIFYVIYGVVSVVIIFFLGEFFVLVIWNQLYVNLNSIKNYFLLKKRMPKIRFIKCKFDVEKVKEFWTPTWKSSLISISSQGSVHITSLVISTILSVNIVASYLFTIRLLQLINEFSWAPYYSQIPRYIQLYKNKQLDSFKHDLLFRLQISILILLFGGILLFSMGSFLLNFIDSNVELLPTSIGLLVLLGLIIERILATHSQVLMFSNDLRHFKLYLFLAFIYLGLIQFLRIINDIEILPIAYLVAAIYPLVIILKRTLDTLKINFSLYLKKLQFLFLSIFALIILILVFK